jgi:hypothetical protein
MATEPKSKAVSVFDFLDSANNSLKDGIKTEVTVILPDTVYYKSFATAIFAFFAIALLTKALDFLTK